MGKENHIIHNLKIGPQEDGDRVLPIYKQIIAEYKKAILEYQLLPGHRIESITELQKKYDVSRETAKKVLSVLCEEGLIEQHVGKGSYICVPREKKAVWGVVLPFYSLQYEDLLRGITCQIGKYDRELRHFCDYNSWENEIHMVGSMIKENYEAIIVIPTMEESKTKNFYTRLSKHETNIIFLDHTVTNYEFPFVIQSYDLGLFRGLRHLRDNTERSIAFIKSDMWDSMNMLQNHLVETYKGIMQNLRPEFEPMVFSNSAELTPSLIAEYGIEGVFCCDDISAVQLIGHLGEEGVRVPDQLRVISYGNTDIAKYFTPAITSIDSCNDEMVRNLIEVLQPVMSGGHIQNRQYIAQPTIIKRVT